MARSWLALALLAALFLAPCWMGIGFFNKNFKIQPDLYLLLFVVGTAIGVVAWGNISLPRLEGPIGIYAALFMVLGVGILFGSWANLLGFRAVSGAGSSAGLAVAILNSAALLIYLLSFPLAWALPRWFDPIKFQPLHLLGILLTITGVGLIALKR